MERLLEACRISTVADIEAAMFWRMRRCGRATGESNASRVSQTVAAKGGGG